MRAGAEVIYQATFVARRLARARRLPRSASTSRPSSAPGATRPTTRSSRARAKPAAVLQLAFYSQEIARDPGAAARAAARRARARASVETYRPGRRRRLPAHRAAAASRARRRRRPTTYPWPCEHCSRCDFIPVCRERWDARRPPDARRLDPARPDREARTASASTTLAGLAESPPSLHVRRLAPPMLERAARPGRPPAPPPPHRRAHAPPARAGGRARASGSCRRRRRATSSSTWRATRSSSPPAGSSSCSACSAREPDGTTDVPADLGPRPRRRAARRSSSSSTSSTSGAPSYPDMHVYHYAAYEPSTLARLMGAHATREDEVDELLRGEVLRRPAPGRPPGPARRRPTPTR